MSTEETETTPQVIADMISLVAGVMIPAAVIATWTPREREDAVEWAAAEHLSASDNTGTERFPQPVFVHRAAEICSSPVMAQLAAEYWMTFKTMLEDGSADRTCPDVRASIAAAAQNAITGLLVLLGDRPVT